MLIVAVRLVATTFVSTIDNIVFKKLVDSRLGLLIQCHGFRLLASNARTKLKSPFNLGFQLREGF